MRDCCFHFINFVGSAVGDVTTPSGFVLLRRAMMPVRCMKGGTTRLHQLRGDKSIHCVDQKPLRIGAEWLRIVGAFMLIFLMLIGVAHQPPDSYEAVRV